MVTQRDRIWFEVLRLMEFRRTFTAAEIQNAIGGESPTIRTIRNALNAMEFLGLLGSHGGTGSAPREYSPIKPDAENPASGYSPRKSSSSSIIPYPGGKGRLSNWIIDQMPAHDTFVEVFGGAAGVLFNKPKSKYEIYNDTNDDLTQFFTVLRDQPDALAAWLRSVPYSRTQYEQWVEEFYRGVRPEDPIERAGRFFSLRYMQYIGFSSGPNGFKSRAKRSPARTFDNARKRINSLARRFDQVIIENQDYQEILRVYDDTSVDVLFYADPPYIGSEGHYRTEFDHDEFVDCLCNVENDWIVSYTELPDGLEEYTVIERETRHRMKRGSGSVTEKLVCNFSPEERTPFENVGRI